MADDNSAAALRSAPHPKQVLVQGAGIDEVNGLYSFVGIHNNRGMYCKQGMWEGKSLVFTIFRHDEQHSTTTWCISKEPNTTPGMEFYYAYETNENAVSGPPLNGWNTFHPGSPPKPTLALIPEHGLQQVPIVQQTASAYEKLLLSEDFSDVKLVCEDEVIPAHRNVLAVSSSYFNAAFNGPWNENEKGELKISYPSKVTKTVLKVFYTGVVDVDAVKEEPIRFISIAAEFDLPWLKHVAEKACAESIDKNNLKDIWQVARLYDCSTLKGRCIDYAQANSLAVLLHGGITDLRTVDPPSWEEFVNEMEKDN